MTVNRTTLLDLPLPVTGTESGTWGDTTNNGLTEYLDIAVAGMTSLTSANFTAGALTISNTTGTSSATNIAATSAQYATIKVSSLATNSTITAPSSNRSYRIINADGTYSLTIKASGQTGVVFSAGQTGIVAFNGTDYVLVGSASGAGNVTLSGNNAFTGANTFYNATGQTFAPASTNDGIIVLGRAGGSSSYRVTLAPTTLSASRTVTFPDADINFSTGLGVAQGGTGATTLTANNVLLGNGTSAITASGLLSTSAAVTSGTYIKGIGYADTVVALGNTGNSINIDIVNGGVVTATLTGNCTFTLRYPVSSGASSFTLILTNDGTAGRTVAWSGGTFKFPGGASSLSRTTTANAVDVWVFFTPDGGTTYYGNIVMKNMTT